MPAEWLATAGAVTDSIVFAICAGILLFGCWVIRNPVLFWEQFNPYLKPYGRATLALGRMIGSLWALGAALGCVITFGDAVRATLHHHWM
jgi:ABC-type transport system involved in multi-copper enzyme maturation permease subunit